jgi:hypothetical protein
MTNDDHPQLPDDREAPRTLLARFRHAIAASSFNSRMVIFSGIGCLAALIVLSVIAYSISRSNAINSQIRASLNSNSSDAAPSTPLSIAKPSPIGRIQPARPTQPVPRPAAIPKPAPAPPPIQSRAAVVTPPAPRPVENAAQSLPFGIRMAANRDGFNNGCRRGRLILEISTVTFTCPHDTSKNVAVSAGQVKSLDNNGIVVFPRQKYHFDIAGKQKQDVHELFAEWLANARRASSARASN